VDFGDFRAAKPAGESEDDEKPDAKLLAVAIAPIDNETAIQELQRAASRRGRGNGMFGNNGNGSRNGGNTAITLPKYEAPPRPSAAGGTMNGSNGNGAPRPCRICLTERFVCSDDFASLPGLLQSCPGNNPVEVSVNLQSGASRRWRIPGMTVNSAGAAKLLRVLPGVQVEE
jgi:hypothetical protein